MRQRTEQRKRKIEKERKDRERKKALHVKYAEEVKYKAQRPSEMEPLFQQNESTEETSFEEIQKQEPCTSRSNISQPKEKDDSSVPLFHVEQRKTKEQIVEKLLSEISPGM